MRPETKQLRTFSFALLFAGLCSFIFALIVTLDPIGNAYAFVFTGLLFGLGTAGMVGVLKRVRERKADEEMTLNPPQGTK